jgi:hypothetical protein
LLKLSDLKPKLYNLIIDILRASFNGLDPTPFKEVDVSPDRVRFLLLCEVTHSLSVLLRVSLEEGLVGIELLELGSIRSELLLHLLGLAFHQVTLTLQSLELS